MSASLVIIGGGIAGLSSAYYAQQAGIPYALHEASGRWGGKIQTEHIDTETGRFVVEWGPDAFITQKPYAYQLATELGLDAELIGTNDEQRTIYVLSDGRLRTLPDGMMLIIPTRFAPFARSALISPLGKLRMGLEAFIPARTDDSDESLANFVRRRLGQEALDKLAEPLMSGIYNTNAEDQSVLATFPRFRAIEKQYGSLTRGMLDAKRKRPPTRSSKSMFMSFREGMGTLISALVDVLDGDLHLNSTLTDLKRVSDGYQLTWDDGTQSHAQQVILTTSAPVATRLLQSVAPDSANLLGRMCYVATGTVSLAYHQRDVAQLPTGFGVVIPRSERRQINAITISSTKFSHRAPVDAVLLRVFFGGARTPQTFALDDEALIETVQDDLQDIVGIHAQPILTRIVRHPQATPQYTVGHLDHVRAIENGLPPGLRVSGSAYHGVGVPDCIHDAQQVIASLLLETHPVQVS
ncbi:MAG: protoporphyrinogen oxidase [Anaerolineae bacterium]